MNPDLAIVLFTYDRPMYAAATLRSTLEGLSYSGRTHVHIADDGSPAGQVDGLVQIARAHGVGVTTSNSGRQGYGASYNLATQTTHVLASLFLCLEDDWELRRPLGIDPLAEALQDPAIECIRLGYIGWTQELRGKLIHAAGQSFLAFDPESPERHVFAGHPRLETLSFQRNVGPWPEGLNAGATEFEVAGRPEARRGVVWPLDLAAYASQRHDSVYAHIGAEQAREDQRESASA